MAKVGKISVALPDEWFQAVEEANIPYLEEKGHEVAGNINPKYETGVLIRRDRNGHPVALVALQHPNGAAIQAKTAEITRAAANAGVDVHRYRQR